jgi:hypothetical protein
MVLWQEQVSDDAVVVACPDAVDRAIKQSLAVHHLQQRPMPPGSYEHVVNAAGYTAVATSPARTSGFSAVNVSPGSVGRAVSQAS